MRGLSRRLLSLTVGITLATATGLATAVATASSSLAATPPPAAGTVGAFGFGENSADELGDGSTTEQDSPLAIAAPLAGVALSAIDAGPGHSLAVTSAGGVYAWGDNGDGQLGSPGAPSSDAPIPVLASSLPAADPVVAVSAGGGTSFAVTRSGALYGWGAGAIGTTTGGSGGANHSDVPVAVTFPTADGTPPDIVAVSAGEDFALALSSTGTVYGWGDNSEDQTGTAGGSFVDTPVAISTLTGITGISAGADHGLAVDAAGTVYAWGDNSRAQLAEDTTTASSLPVVVAGVTAASVSAGGETSFAVTAAGKVYAWGDNSTGQLSTSVQGTSSVAACDNCSPTPAVLPDLPDSRVLSVAAGAGHDLAVLANGEVYAWGDNGAGELGNDKSAETYTVLPLPHGGFAIAPQPPVQVEDLPADTGAALATAGDSFSEVVAAPDHVVLDYPATTTSGAGHTLTATVTAPGGEVDPAYSGTLHFAVSDSEATPPVDTATTAGVVTVPGFVLRSAGSQTLTVTDTLVPAVTGAATTTVEPGAATSILVSPSTQTVGAGDPATFTVHGADAAGNDTGDVTAATSLDAGTAGTCGSGTCTLTLAGLQTVTATYQAITGTAQVDVTPGAVESLSLSPATSSVTAGGVVVYRAHGEDAFGNTVEEDTTSTTFSVSPDGVCDHRACTFPHVPSAPAAVQTVTGTFLTPAGVTATGTASVTVAAGPLARLAVTPDNSAPTAGTQVRLTVEGFDDQGNDLGDVTAGSTFTLTGGSCTGATSVCTTRSDGSQVVTATDGQATGTTTLDVAPGALDHLVLSPATQQLTAGSTQDYAAEGFDAAGNDLGDLTGTTTFTVADGSCAANACTAVRAGDHLVTGTVPVLAPRLADAPVTRTASGTAVLTIAPAPSSFLTVSAPPATTAGQPVTVTVTAFDPDGNVVTDYPDTVHFTSSDAAAVLPADYSFTTADRGVHSFQVTYRTATGPATPGAGQTVTATDLFSRSDLGSSGPTAVGAAGPDHLALNPPAATVRTGQPEAYTAEVVDAFDNPLSDASATTSWSIGPDGTCLRNVCTPSKDGVHTVTGTSAGLTGTASLSATPTGAVPPPVAGGAVTLRISKTQATSGTSVLLSGTVTFDGTSVDRQRVTVTETYVDGRTVPLGVAVTRVDGTFNLHFKPLYNGTVTAHALGASASVASRAVLFFRHVTSRSTGHRVTVTAQLQPGYTTTGRTAVRLQLLLVDTRGHVRRVLTTVNASPRVLIKDLNHGVTTVMLPVTLAPGSYRLAVRVLATPVTVGATSTVITAKVG